MIYVSHSDNYSQCKCACTLGMCCSVRACADLFSWMARRGVGARPLITCGVESGGATSTLHKHSQSTAAKSYPINVLRPSTHHRWRSSNGRRVGLPHRYPEQLPPLFWLQKIAKKYGYWCSTGPKLTSCTKLFKIRPPSATIGKWKICCFVLFGDIYF